MLAQILQNAPKSDFGPKCLPIHPIRHSSSRQTTRSMEPRRKKSRETKLASVNYEKPDFGDLDAEEQNFPPSGFCHLRYGDSRHHLDRNEPFQWHVDQHTRPLDNSIKFLSLGVVPPRFSHLARFPPFHSPPRPSTDPDVHSKHVDVSRKNMSKGVSWGV